MVLLTRALLVAQAPQVPSSKAASRPHGPQPALVSLGMSSQVQDLAPGFGKLHPVLASRLSQLSGSLFALRWLFSDVATSPPGSSSSFTESAFNSISTENVSEDVVHCGAQY